MPCDSSFRSGAAAPLVWRLASGVIVDALVLSAPTNEYDVRVTTEMPPSGSVDVSVAVTSFEEGDTDDEGLPVVVAPGVVVCPGDVVWVTRVVSSLVVVEVSASGCQLCYSRWLFFFRVIVFASCCNISGDTPFIDGIDGTRGMLVVETLSTWAYTSSK